MAQKLAVRVILAVLLVACLLSYSEATSRHHRCECSTLKKQVKLVYQYIVDYGLTILSGQHSIAHLWAPNARARISPLGSYDNLEAVLEYFYGLGAGINIKSLDFVKLVCDCGIRPPVVSADVNAYAMTPLAGRPPMNVTQFGFFTFSNTNNTIVSAELTFVNAGANDAKTDAQRQGVIALGCGLITMGRGNGTIGTCYNYQNLTEFSGNTPAEQYQDCTNFMNSIPYGSFARAYSNTTTCRYLHSLLTIFKPQIHCPHVGKTGGGACLDFPYESWYEKVY